MRLAPLLILALVTGSALNVGCDRSETPKSTVPKSESPKPNNAARSATAKGSVVIFKTAEEARAHVLATKITGDRFELAISDDFTFAGRPDKEGAGMAIVLDAILAQDYTVDGFEQRDGYRVYRYKPFM
jgi:hypothetical protein